MFKWRQTAPELILCAVRWYLRYSLSLRVVEELLDERGLQADHTTVWRWVQRYGPELEQRLRRHLKPTNKSWRVDETYVRVKGGCRPRPRRLAPRPPTPDRAGRRLPWQGYCQVEANKMRRFKSAAHAQPLAGPAIHRRLAVAGRPLLGHGQRTSRICLSAVRSILLTLPDELVRCQVSERAVWAALIVGDAPRLGELLYFLMARAQPSEIARGFEETHLTRLHQTLTTVVRPGTVLQ